MRALVIVTPSTIADKSFAIWLHFAFGIFPLRLPLACATNFERNMSSKVSLSVALSVCPSIYLYLVYLAGSLSVTQPSLSLPVYRFFGCLDFATATKNVPATLCIEVFVTLPELLLLLLLLLQPMQLAIFHTTSQSVPPFPPLKRRLPICACPRCNHMHCLCLCAVGACPKLQPVSGAANKQTKIKIPTTTTKTTSNNNK